MKKIAVGFLILFLMGNTVLAQPQFNFKVPGFKNGGVVPNKYTFCIPATSIHIQNGQNLNPELQWSSYPQGTRSLAIIMVDPDVPLVKNEVNKEGVSLAKNLARKNFYHWVLVDIPIHLTGIKEGQDSNGISPHGKAPGPTPYGVRGVNDYTSAFAADPNRAGEYGGYDGPCPPWNDTLPHHYKFTLYALDVPTLGLIGNFDGPAAVAKMQGHILGQKEWVGIYSLYKPISKAP